MQIPSACRHPGLKTFLSHHRTHLSDVACSQSTIRSRSLKRSSTGEASMVASSGIIKSIYNQVTSSFDDILTKSSMIDVMAEKLNRQAVDMAEAWEAGVTQIGSYGLELGSTVLTPYALRALRNLNAETLMQDQGDPSYPFPRTASLGQSQEGQSPSSQPQTMVEETGFTAPITEFLVEAFGLRNGDWLRKQALVIVMQQLLGSTIER